MIKPTRKSEIAKAGKLICVDSGEYSDYSVKGFFVVLKDFNPKAELAVYLDLNPDQKEDYQFQDFSYLQFLISKGLLLEIEYGNIYLGSYCKSEDFSYTP